MAELCGLFGGGVLPPVARVLHPQLPLLHLSQHFPLFLHQKFYQGFFLLILIVVLFQHPTNLLTLGMLSQNLTRDNLATLFVLTQLLHQPEVESTTIVIIETGIAKLP